MDWFIQQNIKLLVGVYINNIMFSWAQKERLSQRGSVQKNNKSCVETNLQTFPSSPVSSQYSFRSSSKRNSSHEKIKIFLTQKKQKNMHYVPMAANIDHSTSRSHLLTLINLKANKQTPKPQRKLQLSPHQHKYPQPAPPTPIIIKLQVNKLLPQYTRIAKQYLQQKPWGLYGMSFVILKLGFIESLVQDRNIVRELWWGLGEPDILGLYVFLEQVLGGRVQIDLAVYCLGEIGATSQQLKTDDAIKIISERKCSNLYKALNLNRLQRKKNQQNQMKLIV